MPQPGRWLEVEGLSYLVLQRRHRYRLRGGRYQLSGVALMVKAQKQPADSRWWNDRWVIGDPSCRFNARSPLLRWRRSTGGSLRALQSLQPQLSC